MGRGGGGGNVGKGGSLAETHHDLIKLLEDNVNEEITAWNLPLGDRLWLPAAEALKSNTSCKRLTIYGCDIGPEGAAALADALLQNTALQSIDYNENKMTWAGLKKIEAAWEQTRSDSGQHAIATGGRWSAYDNDTNTKQKEVVSTAVEMGDPMAGKSQFHWAQEELAIERRRKQELSAMAR